MVVSLSLKGETWYAYIIEYMGMTDAHTITLSSTSSSDRGVLRRTNDFPPTYEVIYLAIEPPAIPPSTPKLQTLELITIDHCLEGYIYGYVDIFIV